MDDDNFDQIHLVKLRLLSKSPSRIKITCPYHDKFILNVQLKQKGIVYVPLINKLSVSKDLISNSKNSMIPLQIQPLFQYPFDKHNIKIQTYQDQTRKVKGQIISLQLQFSLSLTTKGQPNYIDVYFKYAHLKKQLTIFGKMSPYLLITNDQWKHKSKEIKDGHLSPYFDETIAIPFNSVFDKIIIEVKHGGERIGYQSMYVFEFFGNQQERELELKKQFKMVGTLAYMVTDFEPEDF